MRRHGGYVWHIMVRTLVLKGEFALHCSIPALINVALLIAITLGVSVCSYMLIERPFLALKRYFEPRHSDPATKREPDYVLPTHRARLDHAGI